MSWLWSLASGVASRVIWVIGLWLFAPSVVFVLAAWIFLHDSDFSLWLLNCLPGEELRTKYFYRGKVVWVIGASSGIGRQLALQISRTGGHVILSGRREELLQKVKEECARGYLVESIRSCNRSESKIASVIEEADNENDRIKVLPLDIRDHEKVEAAVREAAMWKQRIDAVFVTAGTLERAERPPLKSELDLFSCNLYPQAHLFRCLLPTFESILPKGDNSKEERSHNDLPSVEAFADLKRLTSQKHVSVTSFVRQASIAGIQKGCEVVDDSWAAKLWRRYIKGEPAYTRFVNFVILSSADARLARPGTAALAAAKKALQIYCNTIAREFFAQTLLDEHSSTSLTVSTILLGAAQTSALKDCLLSNGSLCGNESDNAGLYAESNALPSERVAELVIRTARHNLSETWVAKGTTLFQLYCQYYLPWIYEFLSKRFFDRAHYKWIRAFNLGEIF